MVEEEANTEQGRALGAAKAGWVRTPTRLATWVAPTVLNGWADLCLRLEVRKRPLPGAFGLPLPW